MLSKLVTPEVLQPCSGTVEMLVVEPPAAVENAGAARLSASARAAVIFFLENGDSRLRLGSCGGEVTTIGPLG